MPTLDILNKEKLSKIVSKSDWYLELKDFLTEHFYINSKDKDNKSKEWLKESLRFELLMYELLQEGKINLNTFKLGLDKGRATIDTIVIHHSSRKPDEDIAITGEALSLIRIYSRDFSNKENRYYGKAITSDHFNNGKMTFMPYHYVIWPDGSTKQYLQDENVGKHSGNYEFNCRSIAICFHEDLLNKEPSTSALKAAKNIIQKYNPKYILGHRDISSNTTCPGDLFLGENGWKQALLN